MLAECGRAAHNGWTDWTPRVAEGEVHGLPMRRAATMLLGDRPVNEKSDQPPLP